MYLDLRSARERRCVSTGIKNGKEQKARPRERERKRWFVSERPKQRGKGEVNLKVRYLVVCMNNGKKQKGEASVTAWQRGKPT